MQANKQAKKQSVSQAGRRREKQVSVEYRHFVVSSYSLPQQRKEVNREQQQQQIKTKIKKHQQSPQTQKRHNFVVLFLVFFSVEKR